MHSPEAYSGLNRGIEGTDVQALSSFGALEALVKQQGNNAQIKRIEGDERRNIAEDLGAEFLEKDAESEKVLQEKLNTIAEKHKGTLRKAFDLIAVKPVKWVMEKIKQHPVLSLAAVCAAAGYWYYSAPLASGLSVLAEEGMQVLGQVFGSSLEHLPLDMGNLPSSVPFD